MLVVVEMALVCWWMALVVSIVLWWHVNTVVVMSVVVGKMALAEVIVQGCVGMKSQCR